MRYISGFLAGLSLALAACGGGSTSEPASTLVITLPAASVASGTTMQASASIDGSPASNVTWSSSDVTVASISSTGLITGAVAGNATIHATSGGITGQIEVSVVPGAPASIAIVAGDNQAGPVGSQLSAPLCTSVKDVAGNLIIGAIVTYTVMTGGGELASPTAPATDASGIAISGLWTLGSTPGTQTVEASSAGAGSVTFKATAQSTLTITVPTNPLASGTSVQASASVDGSPATNVTWSSSNSTIASVSATGLITGTLMGTAVIHATSGGVTGQVTVFVIPGAPAIVTVYAGNNQSGPAGSQLSDPLCTNVKDAAGNLIVGTVVTYTVLTGGGQLAQPTAPVTDASGIAISGLWTLGPGTGPQTVEASSPGATSVTFTATAQ
ncbi:MAG TPA: Ig-like domain-containing protein [Gemmatimonadales bacterium]|nr:Ig-like domain-containing protein [Gemmatimonadales bacterium]